MLSELPPLPGHKLHLQGMLTCGKGPDLELSGLLGTQAAGEQRPLHQTLPVLIPV